MEQLLDCRGRDFDSTIIYYGYLSKDLPEEYEIRNHTWKAKSNGKTPRNGVYCTPQEFYEELEVNGGSGTSISLLNINFRNVQYIYSGEYIYWVYCLKSLNLYKFKFIGDNITSGVLKELMSISGFELGYIHTFYPTRCDTDHWCTEVWYNPQKLYIATFTFASGIKGFVDHMIYFKKFESDDIIRSSNTSDIITPSDYINVPIKTITCLDKDNIIKSWSNIIQTEPGSVTLDIYDLECDSKNQRFSWHNYNEMLKKLFNVSIQG